MPRLAAAGSRRGEAEWIFYQKKGYSMQYKITFKWETTETNIGEIIIVGADSEEQALKGAQEIYENGDLAEYILDTIPECDDFSILEVSKVGNS